MNHDVLGHRSCLHCKSMFIFYSVISWVCYHTNIYQQAQIGYVACHLISESLAL